MIFELRLKRQPSTKLATIGGLFFNGQRLCYICEDVVREQAGEPVEAWKVKGKTAIPRGRYQVKRTWSPKFGKVMLELLAVPGFSGIRIHPGNDAGDTEGCLLPGMSVASNGEGVTQSRAAYAMLRKMIDDWLDAGHEVWIFLE